MTKDYFDHKAHVYDEDPGHLQNVKDIADAIREVADFNGNEHLVDFGSGTGLLLEHLAGSVRKITAVDISPSMNAQLRSKEQQLACELEILQTDLSRMPAGLQYDGIVSSMTMHHIENIEDMFQRFYALLRTDGSLCVADLDTEDGSFHDEDTGVHHLGFDRDQIMTQALSVGFRDACIMTVSTARKAQTQYPIFLLTARK